jgi:hypothetical protein
LKGFNQYKSQTNDTINRILPLLSYFLLIQS